MTSMVTLLFHTIVNEWKTTTKLCKLAFIFNTEFNSFSQDTAILRQKMEILKWISQCHVWYCHSPCERPTLLAIDFLERGEMWSFCHEDQKERPPLGQKSLLEPKISFRRTPIGLSKRNEAKFREFSLNFPKLADWLCMGWPSILVVLGREFSNGTFLSHDPVQVFLFKDDKHLIEMQVRPKTSRSL